MKKLSKDGFVLKMLSLALPIAFQQLLVSCAQIVDTAMVTSLGNVPVSAIGIAGRWMFLFNIIIFGIASGTSALIAQFWGAKDKKSILQSYSLAICLAFITGVVFNLLCVFAPRLLMSVFSEEEEVILAGITYLKTAGFIGIFAAFNQITCLVLRSTEDVTTPLITSAVSVLANAALNYTFIYGKFGVPALGVKGAALATVLSASVQSVLLAILCIAGKKITCAKPRMYTGHTSEFFGRFLKVCIPVIFNEAIWAIGTNVYSMVYARYGHEHYAGYTIFNSVEQIGFVFFVGICHACAIMVGKTIGEGSSDKAYSTAKKFIILTPLIGVACGAMFIAIRHPLLSMLNIETQTAYDTAANILLIYSIWLPFRNIPYTAIVGVFRAGGDTRVGILMDTISMYTISIPLVLILGFAVKADFILLIAAMYLGEDALKIVLCLHRFRTRKWIKNLTYSSHEKTA